NLGSKLVLQCTCFSQRIRLALNAPNHHTFSITHVGPSTGTTDSFGLVANLSGYVFPLVHLAIRSLRLKSGVGSPVEPQRSRGHHPRFHKYIGVLDGDFVENFIALTREFLHDMQVGGME